jgi:aminoglycoside phosphotransferase (APT) family kinase protein
MPTAVVLDNHREEVMLLGNLLEKAFPDWNVLPEKKRREQEPFQDWGSVLVYLLAIEDHDVVLCLDLSITDTDWDDVRRGLHWAQRFRADRPAWTFIAYTKHSQYAGGTPEFTESFDGLLEKSELAKQRSFDASAAFVKSIIESARRRRGLPGSESLPGSVRIVDSLGMRSFRAAFSDESLGDIVRDEARDWGPVSVESLTTGYSGAFMLALRSEPDGRSLILKVARTEETIAHELLAQQRYLAELAPFGARFALINPEMRYLKNGTGVYYRQMPVEGRTVLSYCLTEGLRQSLEALARVTRMCVRVLKAVPVRDRRVEVARSRFTLSPVDIGRLETSAMFLSEIGVALAARQLWPVNLPSALTIASEVIKLARQWSGDELTAVQLAETVQHGDLNPGNVIIDGEGVPVLVDFQRLGPWPIGYDLTRLAGLLQIRLTDARDRSDWLPFNLGLWSRDVRVQTKGEYTSDPVCPESSFCDEQFFEYATGLDEKERASVVYGYRLGALWDMIKVCSYQDISVFKRTWALIKCWRLIQVLRHEVKSL